MSLSPEIDATDGLIVNFDKPQLVKEFKITLTNKGKSRVRLKRIAIYSDCIKVLNFYEEHGTIESGGQKDYFFATEYASKDPNEGKVRFSFNNRSSVTRTIKIVRTETSRREESAKSNNQNENEQPKVSGVLYVDMQEPWLLEFRRQYPIPIEITDNLSIDFGRSEDIKFCEVKIRNNTWEKVHLEFLEISLSSVKCNDFEKTSIEPRGDVTLKFTVKYSSDRFGSIALIRFGFSRYGILRRSLRITYRKYSDQPIERNKYNVPEDLASLIFSESTMPSKERSEFLDKLDNWIPTIDQDYASHFHALLYVEEIGLLKEFKEKYFQNRAYFSGMEYYFDDKGQTLRREYDKGIYDLKVNDLFEIRPSLRLGDQIVARKNSSADVAYEGVIMEIRNYKNEDLAVVKFKNDFVETFDSTAYLVEFRFSRLPFIRRHLAVELADKMFGDELLSPTKITMRNTPKMNIRLKKNKDLVFRKNGASVKWFNTDLNEHQKYAVQQVLRSDMLNPYVIFGPPGTGKTTTLQEIILQILANDKTSNILITTQSNSAANLIAQRLVHSNKIDCNKFLRIISFNYFNRQVNMIPDDIKKYSSTFENLNGEKKTKFHERLEEVKRYRVVVGTSSTVSQLLEAVNLRTYFTHAIIDEAGQCTEIDVLIPMVLVGLGGQTIMAGDPMQMPPLIINKHANLRGLSISMLSRLIECYSRFKNNDTDDQKQNGNRLVLKLVHNYRSLPSILEYYNTQFYHSELIPMLDAKESREAKLLRHLSDIFPEYQNGCEYGIHFIDVDGRNEKLKHSWFNVGEVQVTKQIVDKLLNRGLNENDIGIITPYAMQTRALGNAMQAHPDTKVGTVEDFQGLERKVVIISTVRTCTGVAAIDVIRRLGFIQCPKRINVALSRARVMVVVIGKAELLSHDENWNALIKGCQENKTYRHLDLQKKTKNSSVKN